MQKYQIDSLTLAVAALAAALALTQLSGPFAWMSSIGGLVLLLVLLSFDQEGYRTVFQSLGFSAVCGFCAAVASGIIYQLLSNAGEIHLANGQWATEYVPLTFTFATAIFWAIDLMRMNARKVAPVQVPRALGEFQMFPVVPPPPEPPSYVPSQPPAATSVYQPAAPVQAPVPEPAPIETAAPANLPVQPREAPATSTLFASAPVSEVPRPREAPTPSTLSDAAPPTEPAQPLRPGPAPVIPRSGKETMIYVSLLGEGLNVLRSVRAEALGRDFYRIIDEMPEGETWQFQPGQVVRCKKKNLSSGKAMVAMEEAPRAT